MTSDVIIMTRNKDEFIVALGDGGEWIITHDNHLVYIGYHREHLAKHGLVDGDIKESIELNWCDECNIKDELKIFCTERHPEINVEAEVDLSRHEKVYGEGYLATFAAHHEFSMWKSEKEYKMLESELEGRGYTLIWIE